MHKLVILVGPLEDRQSFEEEWPSFLHLVEEMPGLRREATSQVERFLFGDSPILQMHELFFDTLNDLERAMISPPGRAAGRLLQQMTTGRVSLFLADHKEDDLANIMQFKQANARSG